MDKITITRAFNKMIFEFLDDIISIVPENIDIKNTKIYFETIKNLNPSLIIKLWYTYVYDPYKSYIDEGNVEYFINKNYISDVQKMQNVTEILNGIQKIRDPIRGMTETNKAISMTYIQKLSKLSEMYAKF
jgi:hypothetical protein